MPNRDSFGNPMRRNAKTGQYEEKAQSRSREFGDMIGDPKKHLQKRIQESILMLSPTLHSLMQRSYRGRDS